MGAKMYYRVGYNVLVNIDDYDGWDDQWWWRRGGWILALPVTVPLVLWWALSDWWRYR